MKGSFVFHAVSRLLLIAAAGTGLGLSIWELIIFLGWDRATPWIANFLASSLSILLPFLALAWSGSVIIYCVLLMAPSTRHIGANWLITTLTPWLFTALVVLIAIYSAGTAYLPSFINMLGQAAYVAAGLSFGIILVPLLLVQAMLLAVTKALQFKKNTDT